MARQKRWDSHGMLCPKPELVWHERMRVRFDPHFCGHYVATWSEFLRIVPRDLYWLPAHWLRRAGFWEWEPESPIAAPRPRELATGLRLRFWKVLERRAAEEAARPLRIQIERIEAAQATAREVWDALLERLDMVEMGKGI